MKRMTFTLAVLLIAVTSVSAQGYYNDYQLDRLFREADRVLYEADRTMRYEPNRPPRPAEVIRYTDEQGRRRVVNRDAYGNYYDYSTFSNYEHSTNTHRNPRYSGYYPTNGYYNGVVYIGTDRPRNYDRRYNDNRRRPYRCNDSYYNDCCNDTYYDDCCDDSYYDDCCCDGY